MQPARIANLLQPFLAAPFRDASGRECSEPAVLTTSQLERISTYIDILLRWNSRVNLTAIRDPEAIVTRHFGESLFAARCLFPAPNATVSTPQANDQRPTTNDQVADVGSGAGFPGIPIKLWIPNMRLTLIESNQKKATFLKELVRALTLTDIDIQSKRAESLPPASFDVVTLRAVERFAAVLPSAVALLKPGGRLALLIGVSQLETARSTLPQFSWSPPVPIPQSTSRIVVTAASWQEQVVT